MRHRAVNRFVEASSPDARAGRLRIQRHPAAFEARRVVARQRCLLCTCFTRKLRQQSRLDQHLKAVANTKNRPASGHERLDLVAKLVPQHYRPQLARAQVVAVAEAAWQHQHLEVCQAPFAAGKLVDVNDFRCAAGQLEGQRGFPVTIGAGCVQDQYAWFHDGRFSDA